MGILGLILGKERKSTQIFNFTLLCGASKGFMKAFKAFINHFESPQRSVKMKIQVNFISSFGIGNRVQKKIRGEDGEGLMLSILVTLG